MPLSRWTLACAVTLAASYSEAKPLSTREAVQSAMTRAREACNDGEASACHWLALLSERHPSIGIPRARQVAYTAKACQSGSSEACTDWGRLLFNGPREDRDLERITKLWTDSCDGGSTEGCRWLASMYAFRETEPKGTSKPLKDARLQGAYEALFFDSQRGRVLSRQFLADRDYADHARLLLACADIAEHQWESATAKVEGRRQLDPAFGVLEELIKDRVAHSDDRWTDAYARAWNAAGRPDLRTSMLFTHAPPVHRQVVPLPTEPLSHFLLTRAEWTYLRAQRSDEWPEPPPETLVTEAVELAKSTDPVTQRFALTVLLFPEIPQKHRDAARQAAKSILDTWTKAAPTNPTPALLTWRLQYAESGPLSDEELAQLEVIAQMPEAKADRLEPYQYALADVLAYLPASGHHLAYESATATLFTDTATLLIERANHARSFAKAERWDRLRAALHAIGERLWKADTLAEKTAGSVLLSWEPESADAVKERQAQLEAWQQRWHANAEDTLLAWPIPQLREEAFDRLSGSEIEFLEHLNGLLKASRSP